VSNEERYQAALKACAEACRIVSQHDIRGLIEAIDHAHAVGPIVDPTLYRDKAEAMEQDRELLQAALPLFAYREKAIQRIFDQATKAGMDT
jgi:hypothetical protein